jgi:regulatory protein SWI6
MVYEMEINCIAIMRRSSDSWLNATQILKAAGIVKARRAKIIEREILIGEHEKVQGGFGKYQGVWINYERGVELCRQYGVEEQLRPLLDYDIGQAGVGAPPKKEVIATQRRLSDIWSRVETPTKKQAIATQRIRSSNWSRMAKSWSGTQNHTILHQTTKYHTMSWQEG